MLGLALNSQFSSGTSVPNSTDTGKVSETAAFTLHLCPIQLQLFYQLLHVKGTSPYHPQTDGLVEHFNQKIFCSTTNRAPAKILPHEENPA